MGFALAQAAQMLGATVTLVSGPVSLATPQGCTRIDVESALDMYQSVMNNAINHDVFISCAAVADYRPETIADNKLKKTDDSDSMTVKMVKNPDIVASIAAMNEHRPFTVGFAAETQNVKQYALSKLTRKNLDMICANDVSVAGQGFNSNDNAITVYWQDGEQPLTLASKQQIALQILQLIADKM